MPARRLTDAQREAIAARREAGDSYPAIARAFGVSVSTVYWICLALGADHPNAKPLPTRIRGPLVVQRNGFPVRRYTPTDDARLIALEAEGKSHSAIGRALGRKPNSVRARLMTLARREARAEAA